jgi:hypothetical protein
MMAAISDPWVSPAPSPVSLIYTGRRLLPLKLRAFLDFAALSLKARLLQNAIWALGPSANDRNGSNQEDRPRWRHGSSSLNNGGRIATVADDKCHIRTSRRIYFGLCENNFERAGRTDSKTQS